MATIIPPGISQDYEFEWVDLDGTLSAVVTGVDVQFVRCNGGVDEHLQADDSWDTVYHSFSATALDGPTNLLWEITKTIPTTADSFNVKVIASTVEPDFPDMEDDFFVVRLSDLSGGSFNHVGFALNGTV